LLTGEFSAKRNQVRTPVTIPEECKLCKNHGETSTAGLPVSTTVSLIRTTKRGVEDFRLLRPLSNSAELPAKPPLPLPNQSLTREQPVTKTQHACHNKRLMNEDLSVLSYQV
jgi:hypothetical protein